MKTVSALAKVLPLCCGLFLMAATQEDCVILIKTENDVCQDISEICPLDCILATNNEGCQICECAVGDEPCASDSDCRDGFVCEFSAETQPASEGSEDPSCPNCLLAPAGRCVEAPRNCGSDADCPEGFLCQFNDDGSVSPPEDCPNCLVAQQGQCIEINTDPCALVLCSPGTTCSVDADGRAQCLPFEGECRSDDDCYGGTCELVCPATGDASEPDANTDERPACFGICHNVEPITCANVLCSPGTTCVETDAQGPQCVPLQECSDDDQCGESAHCEQFCEADPSCPECDVCFMVGRCVEDPPRAECRNNDECDDAGEVCNANEICLSNPDCIDDNGDEVEACTRECWGLCVAPTTSCLEDAECSADEYCELQTTCPACEGDASCLVPCLVEGTCKSQN